MSVQRPVVRPDADLHQYFSQGPRALRRSWLVATTLGESAGFLVPSVVAALVWGRHPGLTLVVMVAAGVGEGLLLGAAQSIVLGREFLGFSRIAWTAATAAGAAAAWFLAMLAVTTSPAWTHWPPAVTVPLGLLLGFSVLVSIGLAQWTVLRRHVARSRTWVPVNAAAWLLGLGVLLGITTPLWHEGQSTALVVAIGALGGLAMALTVAAVTGWWLVRLVSPRATEARPSPPGVPERDWVALTEPTDEFRVFDPVLLEPLPEPVQRWMRHVLAPGAALLTGVEAEWTGHLRLGRTWRTFYSRGRSTLTGGFVWSARTRVAGLPVTGFDRYTRDEGEMRWRVLGRLRLIGASGDEVTRSAAGRHAAELLAAVPAVALDPAVTWEPVDHLRATAHVVVGGEVHRVEVTVDPAGRLRALEMARWGTPPGAAFGSHRFGVLLGEERRFDGYLVPTEVVGGWHIGTGRWDEGIFMRYRVVRCSFH